MSKPVMGSEKDSKKSYDIFPPISLATDLISQTSRGLKYEDLIDVNDSDKTSCVIHGKSCNFVNSFQTLNLSEDIKNWVPVYIDYVEYSKRIASFNNWPIQMEPNGEELSKAGFYSLGEGDKVKCFFCGIGLKNWQRGEKPLEAHKKWNSSCRYFKMVCDM